MVTFSPVFLRQSTREKIAADILEYERKHRVETTPSDVRGHDPDGSETAAVRSYAIDHESADQEAQAEAQAQAEGRRGPWLSP